MAKKLGTGTILNTDNSRKWAGGVKSQIVGATQHKSLNARYIPLNQITLDPHNPRQLAITPERVREIAQKYPLASEWIQGDSPNEWWDQYAQSLSSDLGGKALTDYLDTLQLAIAIKSHERLINPVTVYAEESGSDLRLIAGERRYLSHIILGETLIAARILPNRPDDLEKDLLQWEENNQRLALSLFEQLQNLQRLLIGWEKRKGDKLSVSQMVSLAGLPRVTAHRYLSVIRCLNPQLMQAIESGKVPSLRQAASLAGLSSPELDAALNPSKPSSTSHSAFKIRRGSDYAAIRTILLAAAENLGGKTYLDTLDTDELDSAQQIGDAFDQLVSYVASRRQAKR